jgi:hypothetical protein
MIVDKLLYDRAANNSISYQEDLDNLFGSTFLQNQDMVFPSALHAGNRPEHTYTCMCPYRPVAFQGLFVVRPGETEEGNVCCLEETAPALWTQGLR